MPRENVYHSRVKKVLAYLSENTVATAQQIITETDCHAHDIRRMISDAILTSSLNYNHQWVIATKTLQERKDHWGFFRYRIAKYSRTVPIFHSKRTAKKTISYLTSRRPWGLTAHEANQLLGRNCRRVFTQLVNAHAIQERVVNGEKVFLHRVHKKAALQLNHRKTNPRFTKGEDQTDKEEKVGVITLEELCTVFQRVLAEMDESCAVSPEQLCALLLKVNKNQSFRTMERWIRFNPRVKKAIGELKGVDHSTLNRLFNKISESFLKKVFHMLVMKLYDAGVITGRFLVVDATHIYACFDTRRNTDKYPVAGAKWGYHHEWFYGYKIHLLVDAESEMPVAMILSSGNEYDSVQFVPLLDDVDEQYDFEEIIAVLADAAYDKKDFRDVVRNVTDGIFLPACNPRNSKTLKMMKRMVKKLFERYGRKIQSVQDAFRYLGQRFLTDFNIDLGTARESKLVELIAERLHRPFRAGVERVFSRLKSIVQFVQPQSKRLSYVKKTVWWSLIGQLIQALTADEKGLPGSMRKRTMLV